MRILAWPAFKNQRQNPYNLLLYSNLQELDPLVEVYEYSTKTLLLKQFNIWHFHWPENIFRQPLLTLLRRLLAFIWKVWFAKLRGVRLVWTVHNLQSHESLHPRWEKKFKRWLIDKLDGIIFLTENAHELLLSQHPEAASIPAKVIPHGHYMSSYKNTMNPHAARANLGFDEEPTILLFIGQVRRYKNVLHLIQVFKQITFDHTVSLIVAGSPGNDEALRSELEEAARGIPSIQYLPCHF
ncbi:MAG: glycosyl transferase group 1 [Sporomusa sp.]|nr:glycosyl transferase group 1 [Sporomusa sp.]